MLCNPTFYFPIIFPASGDASSHIFVEELKTWRDAQSHCRGLLTELVSIQSAEENKAVLNISKSQSVWIGLFRDPWKWSDGSKSSFRFWISDQPSGIVGKKCVVAGFDQEGKWENRNCNNQYSFICYENLILIQKNLSWIEALSYCREHYFDLVHIINKDIQDKVAQKTKSATSSHVWLGLRYSCNFKFWFWAGSTSGCYQNWVRGEGPDKVYECDDGGFSGAINATGGQQWIGLRETKKLNFVCNTQSVRCERTQCEK
uniref:Macrophage mannose receptor 1-like n=1 Tax=Kryptolebias marmoratus TaxID=37003 RepID=A0A3Q3AZR5_KRYMA